MVTKMYILLICGFVGFIYAFPASNEQLDKATIHDVTVNQVGDKVISQEVPAEVKKDTSIEISGIKTGPENAFENTTFKPVRTGTMFARFIDDIFQIPISVLQSVAKLITNPFTTGKKATPEAAAPH